MPSKPKKPCAFPGCPLLTHDRFCAAHAKQEARQYNRYGRDPDSGKRYGRRWAKVRAAFLREHPLCELCSADGRVTPAEMVHHRLKAADGGTNDWDNLQALCQSCHSRLHARQGDYF